MKLSISGIYLVVLLSTLITSCKTNETITPTMLEEDYIYSVTNMLGKVSANKDVFNSEYILSNNSRIKSGDLTEEEAEKLLNDMGITKDDIQNIVDAYIIAYEAFVEEQTQSNGRMSSSILQQQFNNRLQQRGLLMLEEKGLNCSLGYCDTGEVTVSNCDDLWWTVSFGIIQAGGAILGGCATPALATGIACPIGVTVGIATWIDINLAVNGCI